MTNYTAAELTDLENAILAALQVGLTLPQLAYLIRQRIQTRKRLEAERAAADQQVDDEHDKQDADDATRSVAPAPAVWPRRKHTEQHEDEDDEKDS